jgi:hypothetical protein
VQPPTSHAQCPSTTSVRPRRVKTRKWPADIVRYRRGAESAGNKQPLSIRSVDGR